MHHPHPWGNEGSFPSFSSVPQRDFRVQGAPSLTSIQTAQDLLRLARTPGLAPIQELSYPRLWVSQE